LALALIIFALTDESRGLPNHTLHHVLCDSSSLLAPGSFKSFIMLSSGIKCSRDVSGQLLYQVKSNEVIFTPLQILILSL